MYALIVFKPFSLQIVSCSICDSMSKVVEAAEKIDPNVDIEPLFYNDDPFVETDRFIFRLTTPEFIDVSVAV